METIKKYMIETVKLCETAPDKNCINYGVSELYYDTFKSAQLWYETKKDRMINCNEVGYGLIMYKYNEKTKEYEYKKEFMNCYR